jgi:hypothetical protein
MQSLIAVTPALVRRWDIPCRSRLASQRLCNRLEIEVIRFVKGLHGKPSCHNHVRD